MKKNILIVILFSVLTVSCEDWFDVDSSSVIKGDKLFETEQGFKDVLTGVYSLLSTEQLYGRELTFGMNDVRAGYWHVSSPEHTYKYFYNYDYTNSSIVNKIDAIWSRMYKAISNLNSILQFIDEREKIFTGDNYRLIKGEVLALRAFIHFDLFRLYGPSLKVDGAMNIKVMPYYKEFTNTANKFLSSEEVLIELNKDLIEAMQLLKDVDYMGPNSENIIENNRRKLRMNYWATVALAARVNLYYGDNVKALEYAQEIIGDPADDPKAPLAVNTSSTIKNFDTERIFSFDVQKLEDYSETYCGEDVTSESNSALLMNSEHFERLFQLNDASDIEYRRDLWVTKISDSDYTLSKISETTILYAIRLSELYYIAAECSEKDADKLAYLNKIRAGRGLAPISDMESFDSAIETEYLREFIGDGQLFYYYKRVGRTKNLGLVNKSITLEQYALPLSKDEIEFGKYN